MTVTEMATFFSVAMLKKAKNASIPRRILHLI